MKFHHWVWTPCDPAWMFCAWVQLCGINTQTRRLPSLAPHPGCVGRNSGSQPQSLEYQQYVLQTWCEPTQSTTKSLVFAKGSSENQPETFSQRSPGLSSSALHCWVGTSGDLGTNALSHLEMALSSHPAGIQVNLCHPGWSVSQAVA